MIVTKECLRQLAESVRNEIALTILEGKLLNDSIEVEFDEEITIGFNYDVDNSKNRALVKVSHKGVDIGTVQIKDLDTFKESIRKIKGAIQWGIETEDYLIRQLSRYLINRFMTTDPAMIDVKDRLMKSSDTVRWSVGKLNFSACSSQVWTSIRCKAEGGGVLYENIKTNVIGVTTAQGYQGLSVANLIAESQRVLAAAITCEAVSFPVEV
uniref:Uncharacterized protein n=1 Tax=Pantoea phage Survivor TaxID=3232176 RepID=A0AAU8KY07_9CAUD